jgi:hypothetical protein
MFPVLKSALFKADSPAKSYISQEKFSSAPLPLLQEAHSYASPSKSY